MARYCFYIDGFNVYYALRGNLEYRKYKWLNYRKLAEMVIRDKDTVEGVYYFSTPVSWKPASVARHKVYIKALRSCGVEYIKGRFKIKDIKCHKCHQKFTTHEEKTNRCKYWRYVVKSCY